MSKLDGIKAGDRVKIGLEGTVSETGDCFSVKLDGWRIPSLIHDSAVEASTFQITRIEPAFKVGDRVKAAGVCDASTIVAFLSDGRVVCEYEAGDTTGVCARHPSCLTHA